MARFKKVSHQFQDYSLNICDICDLPFNNYTNCDICDSCLEIAPPAHLKELKIKLAWLVLSRAVINQENSTTARRQILAIAKQKPRYKHKQGQLKIA